MLSTNYKDFINENLSEEDIDDITDDEYGFLNTYDITKYEFNPKTKLIDVKQSVNIFNNFDLKVLPIRFGIIYSNFRCMNNKLTSLENCPKKVDGFFYCNKNNFDHIENYPLSIIKEMIMSDNMVKYNLILQTVKENEEVFEHLLDDKIKFHQMVMRLNPNLIQYYTTITPPTKNSNLLV